MISLRSSVRVQRTPEKHNIEPNKIKIFSVLVRHINIPMYNNRHIPSKYTSNNDKTTVRVKSAFGDIYKIVIDKNKTIFDLKEEMQKISRIPIQNQLLYFMCYDEPQQGDLIFPNQSIGKKTYDAQTLRELHVGHSVLFKLIVMNNY